VYKALTIHHHVKIKEKKAMTLPLALVTGGTGGIGTEICKKFARAGMRVIALDIPSRVEQAKSWQAELNSAESLEIQVATADVADFDSCQAMAEEVLAKHGAVTYLVNAAGITRDSTLAKMDKLMWQDVVRTDLDSVFNITRQFLEPMIEQRYGRIINISSVNGRKGQFGQTNYSAAKAGVHGFTKALSQEMASKGITVNTVSPGYVGTPMVMAIREDVREKIVQQIPMKRLAEPSEIAHVVSFLCDKASGYITGANIDINGGLWMH